MNTEVFNQPAVASSNPIFASQHEDLDFKQQRSGSDLYSGRSCILVLGMHRSGTSALTRTLSLLGVDLPNNLMPAVQGNNDTGFWESLDIYHLNDDLLRATGSHWTDWNRFQPENLSHAETTLFKARAYNILQTNFGESQLFILKDPRICRLLPFWLNVFADLAIQPLCVLPIRHPMEVAASIKRRDGINNYLCQALWLRHVLDAEKGSRNLRRTFCTYDELIIDWQSTLDRISKQLGVNWPINSHDAAKEINEFLQPRLRHYSMNDESGVIPSDNLIEWCETVYDIFMDIIQNGDDIKARNELDSISRNFENACNLIKIPGCYEREYYAEPLASRPDATTLDAKGLPKFLSANNFFVAPDASPNTSVLPREVIQHNMNAELENIKRELAKSKEIQNACLYRLNTIQASETWTLMRPIMALENYYPILVRPFALTFKLFWWTITLRLFKRLEIRRLGLKLIRTGGFDYAWYIQRYPEVVLQGYNPVLHWLTAGWHQGFQPNPRADIKGFLKQLHNPEKLDADVIISYLESRGFTTQNNASDAEINGGFNLLHHHHGHSKINAALMSLIARPNAALTNFFLRNGMSPYSYSFNSYIKSWRKINPINWEQINVPHVRGLVSIILPSYNGETMIREALDSILSQTYGNFELIAINDGSIDDTGKILDEYALRDPRVKVFHQGNQKLPKTLSTGIRKAKGEFITWTSVDNRLSPNFIERMVDSLSRNPDWDMVFANLDIIGDDGEPLLNSPWYANYQGPPGSEHVYLPQCTAELNTWANNFIGAAFLYRARVAWTIGDYSSIRFTTEDYDYWMRVNELMTLRHADFHECLYEYRFHQNSLTSRDEDLGITRNRIKLMIFDEFRRSFFLSNSIWVLTSDNSNSGKAILEIILNKLNARSALIESAEKISTLNIPDSWVTIIHVHCVDKYSDILEVPSVGPISACHAVLTNDAGLREDCDSFISFPCDLLATTAAVDADKLCKIGDGYRGMWSTPSYDDFISLCEIKAKNKQLAGIEDRSAEGVKGRYIPISVVVCTYRRSATLESCLRSLLNQSLSAWEYEICVVNNDPNDQSPLLIIDRLRSEFTHIILPDIHLIDCPTPGLSYARNAGLSEAKGEYLLFLDDDALAAHDCLSLIKKAFDDNPEAGVIGGHIYLRLPNPRPKYCPIGQEGLWSQFITHYKKFTIVDSWAEYPYGALWGIRRTILHEMGGFRTNFGRVGDDYGGGEEIVAAILARNLGHKVGIEPRARVIHDVDPARYSEKHVRKTILAAAVVHYRLHSALYIPFLLPMKHILRDYLKSIMDLLKVALRSLRNRVNRADNVELVYASARAEAKYRVLQLKIKDSVATLRKPMICN